MLHYDPKENAVNAFRAVHLRNDTGRVLAPGSVSVVEAGRFVSQEVDGTLLSVVDDEVLSCPLISPAQKSQL